MDDIQVAEQDIIVRGKYIGEKKFSKIKNGEIATIQHYEKSPLIHVDCEDQPMNIVKPFCVKLHAIWSYIDKSSMVFEKGSIEILENILKTVPPEVTVFDNKAYELAQREYLSNPNMFD